MTQQQEHVQDGRATSLPIDVRWPHLAVLGTVLLTYGFELFNFNVSVDEPLYWNMSRLEMLGVWNNQGRWGMGLTALLLPSTDVPVVPLALGLALSVGAFWWTARRMFGLTEWESALATSLAISLPALVFHFSFTINALGVGLAYAACAGCAALLIERSTVLPMLAAVVLGALAIGVYEGFAFVLGVTLLAVIWRTPEVSTVVRCAVVAVGAAMAWLVVRYLFMLTLPRESTNYVGGMVDVKGAVADPVARIVDAASRTFGIIVERWLYLGYSNPLPALLVGIVFLAGAGVAWSRSGAARLWSVLVLVALPIIPLVAGVMTRVIFQRSMVYLPLIVVVVLGIGLAGATHTLRVVDRTFRNGSRCAGGRRQCRARQRHLLFRDDGVRRGPRGRNACGLDVPRTTYRLRITPAGRDRSAVGRVLQATRLVGTQQPRARGNGLGRRGASVPPDAWTQRGQPDRPRRQSAAEASRIHACHTPSPDTCRSRTASSSSTYPQSTADDR